MDWVQNFGSALNAKWRLEGTIVNPTPEQTKQMTASTSSLRPFTAGSGLLGDSWSERSLLKAPFSPFMSTFSHEKQMLSKSMNDQIVKKSTKRVNFVVSCFCYLFSVERERNRISARPVLQGVEQALAAERTVLVNRTRKVVRLLMTVSFP